MAAPWSLTILLWTIALVLPTINAAGSEQYTTGTQERKTLSISLDCDGGHGVFSCPPEHGPSSLTRCVFNTRSAFGCCGPNNCQVITTCIPYGDQGKSQKCGVNDECCTSCADRASPHCYTVTNPVEQKYSIQCGAQNTIFVTEFMFEFTATEISMHTMFYPSPVSTVSATPAVTLKFMSETSMWPLVSTTPAATWTSTGATPSTGNVSIPVQSLATNDHLGIPVIVGIVLGAVGGALLLAFALWFCFRHLNTAKSTSGTGGSTPDHMYRQHLGFQIREPDVAESSTSKLEGNSGETTHSPSQGSHGNTPPLPPLLLTPGRSRCLDYSNNATHEPGHRQYRADSPSTALTTHGSEIYASPKTDTHGSTISVLKLGASTYPTTHLSHPDSNTTSTAPTISDPSPPQRDDDGEVQVKETSPFGI